MTNTANEQRGADPMEVAVEMTNKAYGKRFYSEIAADIIADCHATGQKVPYGAVPYLKALECLVTNDPNAMYGWDDARSIVFYCLSNLKTYKGEGAKALKAELKSLVK